MYDALGTKVGTILKGDLQSGRYSVGFDARDLPSGVYFYILSTNKFSSTKKMILVK